MVLQNRHIPQAARANLEKTACEVSTFASNSIEGNPLPLTEVRRILKKSRKCSITEREVLNYDTSLCFLNEKLDQGEIDFSLKLILSIQKNITVGTLDKFRSGKMRKEPVVGNDPRVGKPVYYTPDCKDASKLMTDLLLWINKHRKKLDPIIVAVVFHKQFVVVHPFSEGNGRTARLFK